MPGLELLYLRINGDGMLPTLLPGEIVFDEHSKSVAPRWWRVPFANSRQTIRAKSQRPDLALRFPATIRNTKLKATPLKRLKRGLAFSAWSSLF
jgi:hypothetical protein